MNFENRDQRVWIGGYELDAGSFTITLTNDTASYPGWSTSARGLSSIEDIKVGGTATLDVDRETYQRMVGFAEAPAVTFQMTREFGEPDPLFETPSGWRAVLRQMARIVSFEFRKAAGRVEPHVRLTATIPDLRWQT